MFTRDKTPVTVTPATANELSAVTDLLGESEAPLSDAPVFSPQAAGAALLLGLALASPKEPQEPRRK